MKISKEYLKNGSPKNYTIFYFYFANNYIYNITVCYSRILWSINKYNYHWDFHYTNPSQNYNKDYNWINSREKKKGKAIEIWYVVKAVCMNY